MSQTKGTLYLVATPIGNLEDVTHRALRVLAEAEVVACEDTRRTRTLLERYGIEARTISYHEHNERERAEDLAGLMEGGRSVAVVTDAGTPGVNDPGYRLVRAAIERGIEVVPVPGPSALIAALIASGLPANEFYFGGFLPSRTHARRRALEAVRSLPATLIFYETPHRIAQSLADARDVLGEREAAVARELTKIHEEVHRGRLSELARRFSEAGAARGEMVLVIDREIVDDEPGGEAPETSSVSAMVAAFETEGLDHRAALKRAARHLGLTRSEAYRRLTSEKERDKN